MAEQDQEQDHDVALRNKREQRAMWVFSAVIVLIILGGMGANMLFHKEQPAGDNTDISSQSRTAPDK